MATPIPAEKIRLIVFDLDGTLIDSREDLAKSINLMLAEFNRQPLPVEIISEYVGDGAGMLVRRALGDPDDEPFVERAIASFLTHYKAHKLDHTYVYDGVFPALDALRTHPDSSPRSLAVLTNKPVNPARIICQALGLSPYFFQIYGGNSFTTKKPNPEGLTTLIREAGVTPEETVMIGDSDVDILTARRAGTWVIGCLYGLSSHTVGTIPSDCLVNTPLGWISVLDTAKMNS